MRCRCCCFCVSLSILSLRCTHCRFVAFILSRCPLFVEIVEYAYAGLCYMVKQTHTNSIAASAMHGNSTRVDVLSFVAVGVYVALCFPLTSFNWNVLFNLIVFADLFKSTMKCTRWTLFGAQKKKFNTRNCTVHSLFVSCWLFSFWNVLCSPINVHILTNRTINEYTKNVSISKICQLISFGCTFARFNLIIFSLFLIQFSLISLWCSNLRRNAMSRRTSIRICRCHCFTTLYSSTINCSKFTIKIKTVTHDILLSFSDYTLSIYF